MSRFFIDRPIFAWVLAIIVMLAGGISILKLPVAQYPDVAPTSVQIRATYPGADATTLQNTVAQVIEQNMSGLDGLMYMSSNSDSSGTLQLTLSFENGTDPDIAQVQVQNKLQLATPRLPQEVQQQGISVRKSSSVFFLVPGFVDESGHMSMEDIADYVASHLQDPLSRINGVGDTTLFGSQYAMRIWLDPNKLDNYQLTPVDVMSMIRSQNAQIAAGQLGGAPPVKGQQLNASIIAQTRLTSPEQFGNILLKVNSDGSQVRLHDVARIQRGGENYNFVVKING
ncbi:efflux RND transporter permease subunit, partial [Pantoea sp.]